MAMQSRIFQTFSGMRQDKNDYISSPDTSPDACNMQTPNGCLAVATGFSRVMQRTVPTTDVLKRLYVYATPAGLKYLACTDTQLVVYEPDGNFWRSLYRFSTPVGENRVEFLPVKIGSDDFLLVATGRGPLIKWDGVSHEAAAFGSAEQLSDTPVNFAASYFGRLFSSGNEQSPARLYWSKTPGGTRTIEDWRADDASPDVSGGFVDVGTGSDPITGLFSLSNQLLIFKRDTLYRLLGDRPSNYRVLPVDAAFARTGHAACAQYADRLYFLTPTGLCYFDGQTVRRPMSYRALHRVLENCDLERCEAVNSGDMLYFAVREKTTGPYNDLLIEYDLMRDTFMLRRGFSIAGLCAARGELYLLTGIGRVEKFDDSPDYDGAPIEAWWETPRMDFGSKGVKKALGELTCTGSGDPMQITALCDGNAFTTELAFPTDADHVAEAVLRGEGRIVRLRFSNVRGGAFTLDTGLLLRFDAIARPD